MVGIAAKTIIYKQKVIMRISYSNVLHFSVEGIFSPVSQRNLELLWNLELLSQIILVGGRADSHASNYGGTKISDAAVAASCSTLHSAQTIIQCAYRAYTCR